LKLQVEITSFSNFSIHFVAEYKSDAPDPDEEYDVQSDDVSVFFSFLKTILRFFTFLTCLPKMLICLSEARIDFLLYNIYFIYYIKCMPSSLLWNLLQNRQVPIGAISLCMSFKMTLMFC